MTFWEIRNIIDVVEQSHWKLYMCVYIHCTCVCISTVLVCVYPLALTKQTFERFNWIISKIYLISNKWLCSVTYVVELFTYQTNSNISRLKWDTRQLYRPIFMTSKVLSSKRVFFKPNLSFHIPFNRQHPSWLLVSFNFSFIARYYVY